MADKSWNNKDINDRDLDRLFSDLPESEREDLKRVWDNSREIQFNDPEIPVSETEDALESVHKKLGFDNQNAGETSTSDNSFLKYLVAAALILFMAVFGFLLTEKKYTAQKGEIDSFILSDGTRVELNSGSVLSHSRFYGMLNRDITLNGEAYFEVQSDTHPFQVHANGSIVEVTGTKFNVRSWSDDPGSRTTVAVISGSIHFYPENIPENFVRLTEGHASNWYEGRIQPEDPVTIVNDNILAWRNQNLAFVNQPLAVIFRELERKYNITIITSDHEIEESILTTFYTEPESVESILADITTVKGLTYSKTANGYRISK